MKWQGVVAIGCLLLVIALALACGGGGGGGGDGGGSDENITEAQQTLQSASATFEEAVNSQTCQQAIESTITWLQTQDDVSSAKIGLDGSTICITMKSGIQSLLFTDPKNSVASLEKPSTLDWSQQNSSDSLPLKYSSDNSIFQKAVGNNKAILLEAPDFGTADDSIKQTLQTAGFAVTHKQTSQFVIDTFSTLEQYAVIYISAHGGIDDDGTQWIQTGERVDSDYSKFQLDKIHISNAVFKSNEYWVVSSLYLYSLFSDSDADFPDSMVFVNACHSLEEDLLARAFTEHGAQVFLGWSDSVATGPADEDANLLFEQLGDGLPLSDAFSSARTIDSDFGRRYASILDYFSNSWDAELSYYPQGTGAEALLVPETGDGDGGTVISSFNSPSASPEGLAWDGTHLWNVTSSTIKIYKLNPADGSIISSFNSPGLFPKGLAWDGTYLWEADYDTDEIYKLNPADGSIVSSFNSPSTFPMDLAWDGTYLWNADLVTSKIYKLDPSDGSIISSFNSPGTDPTGLAWDGTYLWNADRHTDKIYKLNPANGSIISSFNSPGLYSGGLAWDGTYLWNADTGISKIYKIQP